VIAFASFFADYWYVFALVVIAACWLVFASWPGRRLRRTILARTFWPLRELRVADVFQQLGVAAEAGRPIAGAVSTLARYHFDSALRNQLLFIRNEIEQGADVWQSMGAAGLLAPAEVRVLCLAERVGNRPWALRQIAQLKKRQTTRRLARWSELAAPLVVILMGAFVLFQALGIFGPLASILHSLM
jgi:type II secretory pathway component PulF